MTAPRFVSTSPTPLRRSMTLTASPTCRSFPSPPLVGTSLFQEYDLSLPARPQSWMWSCHICSSQFPLGATRRCLHDGHYFCAGATVNKRTGLRKRHRPCGSVFDYAGWRAVGDWRCRYLLRIEDRGSEKDPMNASTTAGAGTPTQISWLDGIDFFDSDDSDEDDKLRRNYRPKENGRGVSPPHTPPPHNCERDCNFPSECRWRPRLQASRPRQQLTSSADDTAPPIKTSPPSQTVSTLPATTLLSTLDGTAPCTDGPLKPSTNPTSNPTEILGCAIRDPVGTSTSNSQPETPDINGQNTRPTHLLRRLVAGAERRTAALAAQQALDPATPDSAVSSTNLDTAITGSGDPASTAIRGEKDEMWENGGGDIPEQRGQRISDKSDVMTGEMGRKGREGVDRSLLLTKPLPPTPTTPGPSDSAPTAAAAGRRTQMQSPSMN